MELVSKSAVNRAGDVLRSPHPDMDTYTEAMKLAAKWRSMHLKPLVAINILLRRCAGQDERWSSALVARRLKRMPSIIGKLRRFPAMQLSRMQDIGGVRIIVPSISDVYTFHKELTRDRIFRHVLELPPNDYIERPKEDGYRSLHQVFRYKGREQSQLDGLRIEVQIRTRLQHAWATAVEILGLLEKTSFKTGEGEESFKRFFLLASALFAFHEGRPAPKSCSNYSPSQLVQEFEELDNTLQARFRLQALSVHANKILQSGSKKKGLLLLVLRTDAPGAPVLATERMNSVEMATLFYLLLEQEYKDDPSVATLLLHMDNLADLRQAYPNYFLDATLFLTATREICEQFRCTQAVPNSHY